MSTDFEYLNKLIAKADKVMGKTEGRFCGQNNTFPVLDCAHVAVAKAYLSRAQLSKASKRKITGSINRTAKMLGCGVVKKINTYS